MPPQDGRKKIATAIDAKNASTPGRYWAERGLYLEVTPHGSRLWRMKYRYAGKEKRLSFGPFPEVSLADARNARDAARAKLLAGVDPGATRKADKQAVKAKTEHDARGTFEKVATEWIAFKSPGWASETQRKAEFTLERYLIPVLGKHDIATLATKDVAKPLVALAAAAPTIAPRLPMSGARLCSVGRTISMGYALAPTWC